MNAASKGKAGPSLERPSEKRWGDDFRAAVVQSRMHFGQKKVTYVRLAERVSQLVPTTDTTILRLGYLDELGTNRSVRQIAYLALMALGFDPLDFGLEPRDRALKGLTDAEIRKMLDPGYLPDDE